jgi:hypothetical protein
VRELVLNSVDVTALGRLKIRSCLGNALLCDRHFSRNPLRCLRGITLPGFRGRFCHDGMTLASEWRRRASEMKMTLNEFRQSLPATEPPAGLAIVLRALWWDAKGNWTRAHESAQQDEGAEGAWVHAYLHMKEGDHGNAAYWYSRAGKPACRAAGCGVGRHAESAARIARREAQRVAKHRFNTRSAIDQNRRGRRIIAHRSQSDSSGSFRFRFAEREALPYRGSYKNTRNHLRK